MAMKRIMLLGAGGQVAQALRAETLPSDWKLAAYGRTECNITDHRAVQNAIQSFKPDFVINAAAMTNVDLCETNQEQAAFTNFEGPANLAAQCSAVDVPLLHLSTDYVFDGRESDHPYRPEDKMNPINVYGNTKLMGEESVRHEHAWHIILRTSLVFSALGSNVLTKTLQAIDKGDELKIPTDQIACPTYAPDLAKAIITMANAILLGKVDGFGTYHYCGEPAASRFDFVKSIADVYGKPSKITPAKLTDFPDKAPRPAYSALDSTKLRTVYGIEQNQWQTGLKEALQKLKT